nr:PREDICTED: RNA polymerase II subunit A C-terminal domain phosphatase-like [Latimeria chalumnae]|eukprot:XP_005986895.1 PREDICTED: RNA polymerase II subunit A C-terminal domain phosphatase-like [Latimeria chalumnae]
MEDPADSGGGSIAAAPGPSIGAPSPGPGVTEIRCPGSRPLRLLEWKVSLGTAVKSGSVLAVCVPIPDRGERQPPPPPAAAAPCQGEELESCSSRPPPSQQRQAERKVKSDRTGVVKELCCQPGQVIPPG